MSDLSAPRISAPRSPDGSVDTELFQAVAQGAETHAQALCGSSTVPALEIQRAMQFFFTSTQYSSVDHILLAGGSAVIPGLEEVVSTRTQVETMIANPFAQMQTSPRIQLKRLVLDAPSLIVACGLAMRRFDPL